MDFSTGSGGTAGSGGSSGGPSGPPPRVSSVVSSGEFNFRDPVQSFMGTVRGVVTQPVGFFRGMNRQGDFLNPLIFSLVCVVASAILASFLGILGAIVGLGDQGIGASIGGLFGAIIITPIITAVFLFVWAGIIHLLVVLIVKPAGTGYETTFRVIAYSGVVSLISWIPIIGALVGGIWYIILSLLGVREAHSTSTGKAALVVLIPVAVLMVIGILLAAIIGAVIFSALNQ